jgi:hypothetical protein
MYTFYLLFEQQSIEFVPVCFYAFSVAWVHGWYPARDVVIDVAVCIYCMPHLTKALFYATSLIGTSIALIGAIASALWVYLFRNNHTLVYHSPYSLSYCIWFRGKRISYINNIKWWELWMVCRSIEYCMYGMSLVALMYTSLLQAFAYKQGITTFPARWYALWW